MANLRKMRRIRRQPFDNSLVCKGVEPGLISSCQELFMTHTVDNVLNHFQFNGNTRSTCAEIGFCSPDSDDMESDDVDNLDTYEFNLDDDLDILVQDDAGAKGMTADFARFYDKIKHQNDDDLVLDPASLIQEVMAQAKTAVQLDAAEKQQMRMATAGNKALAAGGIGAGPSSDNLMTAAMPSMSSMAAASVNPADAAASLVGSTTMTNNMRVPLPSENQLQADMSKLNAGIGQLAAAAAPAAAPVQPAARAAPQQSSMFHDFLAGDIEPVAAPAQPVAPAQPAAPSVTTTLTAPALQPAPLSVKDQYAQISARNEAKLNAFMDKLKASVDPGNPANFAAWSHGKHTLPDRLPVMGGSLPKSLGMGSMGGGATHDFQQFLEQNNRRVDADKSVAFQNFVNQHAMSGHSMGGDMLLQLPVYSPWGPFAVHHRPAAPHFAPPPHHPTGGFYEHLHKVQPYLAPMAYGGGFMVHHVPAAPHIAPPHASSGGFYEHLHKVQPYMAPMTYGGGFMVHH